MGGIERIFARLGVVFAKLVNETLPYVSHLNVISSIRKHLTGLARIPPNDPVSKPKSMSPTRRQKQENMSKGDTEDHADRWLAIATVLTQGQGRCSKQMIIKL